MSHSPPGQDPLAAAYQPHIYDPTDNTILRRLRFAPSTTGTYPTVVIIHGGEYRDQDDLGTHFQRYADYDLLQAGFLVFSVEHRLAPPGLLPGQTPHCTPADYDCAPGTVESGRPPQQSNDIKQQIVAAYNDAQCNGKIFILGASSGGTHTLWCALDATPLPPGATGWPLPAGKIKAVAGLSGVYDLSLRTPTPTQTFINDVENYTNTTNLNTQLLVSPISLVASATNIPPALMYATDGDSVKPEQATNMKTALNNRVPNIATAYTIRDSSLHSFQYWHEINTNTGSCVSSEVIAFFNTYK